MNFSIRSAKPTSSKGNAFALYPQSSVRMAAQHGRGATVPDAADVEDVQEYTYEPSVTHLDDADALRRYRNAVAHKDADTLVVLQDHDCGHWTVTEYSTPEEREAYFRLFIDKYLTAFMRPFRRILK
jgi:hypothetical protein